jgi:flagellar M-ring protein FliF
VTPLSRGTETPNYEVSKVVRHTVRRRGEIDRLSVAVIVDDEQQVETAGSGEVTRSTTPRTPEQLEKIESLVAAAVGLDPARGDTLTVENIAFDVPEIEEPEPPSAWQVYGPQVLDAARIAAVLLLGVLTFLFVVRPIVRRAVVALPSGQAQVERLPNQLPRTVQEVEGDLEAELDAIAGSRRKLRILTKRLTEMTTKSPDSAARLIRTWLAEEEQ